MKPVWHLALALALLGCVPPEVERFSSRAYDKETLRAVAKQALSALQGPSFAENHEYCGFIGITATGQIQAASPSRGQRDRCAAVYLPYTWWRIAHYHSHGGYDPQSQSEIPSALDIQSLQGAGIPGYLATPGGRFWEIDPERAQVRQLCTSACLPQDPAYVEDTPIAQSYSFAEILERAETF